MHLYWKINKPPIVSKDDQEAAFAKGNLEDGIALARKENNKSTHFVCGKRGCIASH